MQAQLRAVNWSRYTLQGLGTIVAAVVATTLLYFIGSTMRDCPDADDI